MDNLTHTLVAVMMGQAGLRRAAPRATLVLVLAANAPDIDIVTAWGGALNYLKYHRGVTHAALGAPVLALAVTALLRLFWRRNGFAWTRTFLVALAGVATHPLLDLTNTYGVRVWAPFSDTWYSWDILHIVDLWVWGALAACGGAAVLGRLISGEIGARPGTGRGWAVTALTFVVLWCGVRALLHRRAVGMLEAHNYGFEGDRAAPLRVAAFPGPTNPFVWRGLVETDGLYQVLVVRVREPLDATRGEIHYKPERSAVLETALGTRTAREFARFARYPAVRVEGAGVVLTDFRFWRERREAFVCTIALDDAGRVVEERFRF